MKIKKVIRLAREGISKTVVSFHARPLLSNKVNLLPDATKEKSDVCIIIQGPLVTKNNFTLETVKLYKKTMLPDTRIVISTWKGEDASLVDALKQAGADVVLLEKPEVPGVKHINYQVASSRAGIAYAKAKGLTYVLKTRTDVRMYATNVEAFLKGTLRAFPLSKSGLQHERIVAFSANSYKYRPYSISDITLFGTTHDMELYFDVPEDTRNEARFTNIKSWSEGRFCEVYLVTHFLEKLGRVCSYTIEDYWKACAEHFTLLDASTLDMLWYKYDYWKEYRDLRYDTPLTSEEFTFKEWLIMYASLNDKKEVPEYLLEKNFGDKR